MDSLRISTTSIGHEANDQSYFPKISGDGRFVAFQSLATNLAAGDTNGVNDIFVKDLHSGAVSRVGVTAAGVGPNNHCYFPAISGDGRLVAFQSPATNLVPGDTNKLSDIFLKDLQTGALTRISTGASGQQADGMSQSVSLSDDGSVAAFVSRASNLVPGDDNGVADIFVRNLTTGEILVASSAEDGTLANGSSEFSGRHRAALSEDGRLVAFSSIADNLSDDDGAGWDIFVKDLKTGKVALASIGEYDDQPADGDSYQPSMSADGRYVAFTSTASNLVDGDLNGRADVFVKDLATGKVEMISDAWANDTGPGYSRHPAISGDGRYVAFTRVNLDLVSSDVFVKDRYAGTQLLINTNAAGLPSDMESKMPDFSARGARIIFLSYSTDLVPDDTNRRPDVFLTTLLSPLEGSGVANAMKGTDAHELILGLGAADTMRGGGGQDALEAGDGNDWLAGDDGDDVVIGHAGNDVMFGGRGNDSMLGGPGRDSLNGGVGRDTLVGGDGADELNGFKDTDTLIGGLGADVFLFKAADQSPFGAGDTLIDFLTGVDRIDFGGVGIDGFIGTDAFAGGDGVIEARFDPAMQQLQVDMNDSGRFDAGDMEINGVTAIAAADLVL